MRWGGGAAQPAAVAVPVVLPVLLVLVALLATGGIATAASPFAGAVLEEPMRHAAAGGPYYYGYFNAEERQAITRAATYKDPLAAADSAEERRDSLLARDRSERVLFVPSENRYTKRLTGNAAHVQHSLVASWATHFGYAPLPRPNASSGAATPDVTRAWPYYYHHPDFMRAGAPHVHRRVYRGVVDVDDVLLAVLEDEGTLAGPSVEALALVYNDWDDRAMQLLALLEAFAANHTGGRGADMYAEVDPAALHPQVASLLRRHGRANGRFFSMRPGGFGRLLRTAHPPTAPMEPRTAPTPVAGEAGTRPEACLVALSGDALESILRSQIRSDSDGGEGAESMTAATAAVRPQQFVGAVRIASVAAEGPARSSFFSWTPSPAFALLGGCARERCPRYVPSTAATSAGDLERFVLRHSTSSLFVESYAQVASLARTYGRAAFMVLPDEYRRVAHNGDSGMPLLLRAVARHQMMRALRGVLPFFIVAAREGPEPPAWWEAMSVTSTRTLDPLRAVPPISEDGSAMQRATEGARMMAAASSTVAVVSVVEVMGATPEQWTREDIAVPLPQRPNGVLEVASAYVGLISGLLADELAVMEAARPVIVAGAGDFQASLERLRGGVRGGRRDVAIVVDDADGCGHRARAAARAAGGDRRYIIVPTSEAETVSQLHRAAWPRPPASGSAPACEGDWGHCAVFCVPAEGRALYRVVPPPAAEGSSEAVALPRRYRPLEHPPVADVRAALAELSLLTSEGGGDGAAELGGAWRTMAGTGLPWRAVLPEGLSAPLLQFNVSLPDGGADDAADVHVVLLTDATCAPCANPTKAFRLLRHCVPLVAANATDRDAAALSGAQFHDVDVRQLSYTAAARQAELATRTAEMPYGLLGPHFLFGPAAAASLRPPQLVVQRGPLVVATVGTYAYYERAAWPRAVLQLIAVPFSDEERGSLVWADILQCVDSTLGAEGQRRAAFRGGAR